MDLPRGTLEVVSRDILQLIDVFSPDKRFPTETTGSCGYKRGFGVT